MLKSKVSKLSIDISNICSIIVIERSFTMTDTQLLKYYNMLSPEGRACVDQLLSEDQPNYEFREKHYDIFQEISDPEDF